MRQRGDGLGLALEARQGVGVGSERLRQHLDGDVPVELPVARPIDLSHAPGAERREDLVGAEACSGCEVKVASP